MKQSLLSQTQDSIYNIYWKNKRVFDWIYLYNDVRDMIFLLLHHFLLLDFHAKNIVQGRVSDGK